MRRWSSKSDKCRTVDIPEFRAVATAAGWEEWKIDLQIKVMLILNSSVGIGDMRYKLGEPVTVEEKP